MPGNLTFIEAASIPLAAASAYQAIQTMDLKRGQHILIHGGSGGIGTFAIQIAKHLGAYVIATATGEGLDFVRRLGADEVMDYKTASIEQHATNIDAILDTVGGDTYKKSFQIVKAGGIIVSMLMQPDENLVHKYNVRSVLEMTEVNADVLNKISDLVKEGALHTYVAETYSLMDTRKAYEAKDQHQIIGKIVIKIDDEG